MSRLIPILSLLVIVLSACSPLPVVPTVTYPKKTASITPVTPTPPEPTDTTTPQPTATITPAFIEPIQPDPMSINAQNAATQLELLGQIGSGYLYDVKWSPDGKSLAIASGAGVFVYDSTTYQQTAFFSLDGGATAIAFSPDAKKLAVAGYTKVSIWDLPAERKIKDLDGVLSGDIWKLAYGQTAIAAYGRASKYERMTIPRFRLWQESSGQLLLTQDMISSMQYQIAALDFDPAGISLLYLDTSEGLLISNFTTNEITAVPDGGFDAMFSPDRSNVLTIKTVDKPAGLITETWITNLDRGKSTQILPGETCEHFSHNGTSAICYNLNSIVLFDPFTGEFIQKMEGFSWLYDADISPNGQFLAIREADTLRIIDTHTQQKIKSFDFDSMGSFDTTIIQIDGDEHYAVAYSHAQGRIKIRDLSNGTILRKFESNMENQRSLAFSPDRNTLISLDADNILRLWNIHSGMVTHQIDFSEKSIYGPIKISPDGINLALQGYQNMVLYEFNLQTGVLRAIEPPPFFIGEYEYWYDYTPQGHLIAGVQRTENVIFYDVSRKNFKEMATFDLFLKNDITEIDTLGISPDNNFIAAGQMDGLLWVWDLNTKKSYPIANKHNRLSWDGGGGTFEALLFNPQNDLLLSLGLDHTARLWNFHIGAQLHVFDPCYYAAFTPDGRLLVTEAGGVIRIWGVAPLTAR